LNRSTELQLTTITPNKIMKKLLWTTIVSFAFAGFAFSADCDKCKKKDGAEAKKEEGTVAEGKCKKKCERSGEGEWGGQGLQKERRGLRGMQ